MLRRILSAALTLLAVPAGLLAGTLPRQAPLQFAVHLTNGQQVSPSQFQGKVVALIFILTYCPHCQKAVNTLAKAQADYGSRGFQVIASAIEDHAAGAVPDFLKRFHPPFPVGYNDRFSALEFLQHPMAARLVMPQLVFIDAHGMVRAQYSGDDPFFLEDRQEENVRSKIQELLTPATAVSRKKK
jgi:peroxiredoxin